MVQRALALESAHPSGGFGSCSGSTYAGRRSGSKRGGSRIDHGRVIPPLRCPRTAPSRPVVRQNREGLGTPSNPTGRPVPAFLIARDPAESMQKRSDSAAEPSRPLLGGVPNRYEQHQKLIFVPCPDLASRKVLDGSRSSFVCSGLTAPDFSFFVCLFVRRVEGTPSREVFSGERSFGTGHIFGDWQLHSHQ
jgi:hypothetical protein